MSDSKNLQHKPYEAALQQYRRVAEHLDLDPDIKQKLQWPDRVLEASIHFKDDSGKPRVLRGWRSQFNSALGPCKGGIRFHQDVNRSEVKALSMWMTWKTALLGLPLGGGKGGIRFNPKEFSAHELEKISRAYIRQIHKYLGPTQDVPAPDVGTNGQIMAWMFDEYCTLAGHHAPGVITGKPLAIGGSLGRDKATAFGGFIVLKELMKTDKKYQDLHTVSISGKGNAGGTFIKMLHADDHDWKIICVNDSSAALVNENGFDIPKLLAKIEQRVPFSECSDLGKVIDRDQMHTVPVDLFVPAALEGQIHRDNVAELKTKLILELANGPVTPAAEEVLAAQGVLIVPDILANAGGVTVSYFEQVQNNDNFYWSLEEVDGKLERFMTKAFHDIYARIQKGQKGLQTMRDFAYAIAIERVAAAMQVRA